jgi:pyruvate carboxylase
MSKPTPKNLGKFHPSVTTESQLAEWIRAGDFEQAKELAKSLATFLLQLSENKEVQKSMMQAGIMWIGAEQAKLINERLQDDPAINKEAQKEFAELIKKGHRKGSEKLTKALGKIRVKPGKGKSTKTGAELFAKVLVPNKHTKNQFEARWIATVAKLNIKSASKDEYKRVTEFLNELIDKNNKSFAELKSGKCDGTSGFNPSVPRRRITQDQLANYYREFKPEIDRANGIEKHKIKK